MSSRTCSCPDANLPQDIVELRRKGWRSKAAVKGPATIEEVRAQVSHIKLDIAPTSPNSLIGSCCRTRKGGTARCGLESKRRRRWRSHGPGARRCTKLLGQQPDDAPSVTEYSWYGRPSTTWQRRLPSTEHSRHNALLWTDVHVQHQRLKHPPSSRARPPRPRRR